MKKPWLLICGYDKNSVTDFIATAENFYEIIIETNEDGAYNCLMEALTPPAALILPLKNAKNFLVRLRTRVKFKKLPVIAVGEDDAELSEMPLVKVERELVHKEISAAISVLCAQKDELIEREAAESKAELRWFESLVDNVSIGIIVYKKFNGSLRPIYFNSAVHKFMGMTRIEYQRSINEGTGFFAVHDDDMDALEEFIGKAISSDGEMEHLFRSRSSKEGYVWIRLRLSKMKQENSETLYVGTLSDVTAEMQSHRELSRRADIDPLTCIYNKAAFARSTQQMLREDMGGSYYLIRINIENFKVVNDLFGIKTGDFILKRLAKEIMCYVDGKGTYGYLGNDNFAFCVPVERFSIEELEDKFLNDAIVHEKYGVNMKISAGIYEIRNHELSVTHMCDRAKLALQSIKGNARKNYAYYNDEMRQSLIREQEITSQMRAAVENKEFVVFLQPIYSTTRFAPVYAEALVRWKHPEKGLVSPGIFIPIFEKNGFIEKLDFYVWEEVCRYHARRRSEGKPLFPISVNVSRASLYNPYLAERIIDLMHKYDIEAKYLKVEITESAYNNCEALIQKTAEKLRQNGLNILIDDFGSGYSSLNTLKDLTADTLKIDMKFMGGFETSPKAGNILTSVIRMAKWLQLPVVAEGVETIAQVKFLRSIGCDYIQGYYFSKPLPIEEFEEVISLQFCPEESDDLESISKIDVDINKLLNSESGFFDFINEMGSSVGVYELNDGRLEAIRVNDKYYDMFGYTPSSFSEKAQDICSCLASEADIKVLHDACDEAKSTGSIVRVSLKRYANDGTLMYIDTAVKYCGEADATSIFMLTHSNATERRMSEIANTAKFDILNSISKMISQKANYEDSISYALRTVVNYFSADRAFVGLIDEENSQIIRTFEENAGGTGGRVCKYEKEIFNLFKTSWLPTLLRGDCVFVEDVSRLPAARTAEKEWLQSKGCEAALISPMSVGNKLVGYVGVSNPRTNTEDISFLVTVSNCISGEWNKNDIEKTAAQGRLTTKQIINEIAEGVATYMIDSDANAQYIHCTKPCREFVGTGDEPVMLADIRKLFTPQDAERFDKAFSNFIHNRERTMLDARCGDKWVMLTFVPIEDENGTLFLMLFLFDITRKREDEREEGFNTLSKTIFGTYDKVYLLNPKKNTVCLLRTKMGPTDFVGVNRPLDKTLQEWCASATNEAETAFFRGAADSIVNGKEIYDEPIVTHSRYEDKLYKLRSRFVTIGDIILLCCEIVDETKQSDEQNNIQTQEIVYGDVAVCEWTQDHFYSNVRYKKFIISEEDPDEVLEKYFADVPEVVYDEEKGFSAPSDKKMLLKTIDGAERWCSVTKFIIESESQKKRTVVSIRDIDEVKRAYDEKNSAFNRLALVLENIKAGVCSFNLVGGELRDFYANRQVLEIFGATEDKSRISCIEDIISITYEEDREILRGAFASLCNNEGNNSFDCRFIKRNGAIYAARVRVILMTESTDEKSVLLLLSDVSGDYHTSQEVEKLRSIVTLPFAIISLNGHGKCDIRFVNEKMCQILGMDTEQISEMARKDIYALVAPKDLERIKTEFMRAAIERGTVSDRLTLATADGEKEVSVEAQMVLTKEGSLICYFSVKE